jgi:RIO kinase 2
VAEAFQAAFILQNLDPKDIRTLIGIELGMRRFQFVPLEQISFYAKLPRDEVIYRLDRLYKLGILDTSHKQKRDYCLINASYDVLAFNAFYQKKVLCSVGSEIGMGKESQVFIAMTPENTKCAVKIHRLGAASFRQVRKLRNYIQNRKHISWLYINRLSAESEFEGLVRAYDLHLNTPKPIAQNRNALVMQLFEGQHLNSFRELDNPRETLDTILQYIFRFFTEAKLIHCDLSEFNILIDPKQNVQIIDFPQWEPANHYNWKFYLTRDLQNISAFFERRYNLTVDIDSFLKDIKEPANILNEKDLEKMDNEEILKSEKQKNTDSVTLFN